MSSIRHSSAFKPRLYPYHGSVGAIDVDRCQTFRGEWTRPNEKVYEHGRRAEMARDWGIPEIRATLTQLEYGTIDIFKVLANKNNMPSGGFQLTDFDTSMVDIVTFEKDVYGGSHELSLWLPKLSLVSFGLNIGDPDARIERTFEFTGEKYYILRDNNKCFIVKTYTVGSGETEAVIDVSDPEPVEDPNNSGKYILRVLKVTGGGDNEATDVTVDATYDDVTKTVTVTGVSAGDVIKVYYTASTFGTSGNPTALNDSDDYFVKAKQCSVYLVGASQHYIHKLSSLTLTCTFDRINQAEIGSDEKILRETREFTTTVTLRGFVKTASIDEIMAGKAGQDWGIIDIEKFVDTVALVVAIYDSPDKSTFKIGYKISNLKYPSGAVDAPLNDFLGKDLTFEADNLIISTNPADLGLA